MSEDSIGTPWPAIVLCDSLNPAPLFPGLSLWPIAGRSSLELCLEWIVRSNGNAAYVYSRFEDDTNRAITKELVSVSGIHTEVFQTSPETQSLGDCLRHADSIDLLAKYCAARDSGNQKSSATKPGARPAYNATDFLLIGANTFAQESLAGSWKLHRSRREKDRSCVATLLCCATDSCRGGVPVCLVTDKQGRLLFCLEEYSATLDIEYKKIWRAKDGEVILWPKVFVVAAICAPEVLIHFSDSFDDHSVLDVIRGCLANEEVIGHYMYVDVLDGDMAKCGQCYVVSDFVSFAAATRYLSTLRLSPAIRSDAVVFHRFPGGFTSSGVPTGMATIDGISFVHSKTVFSKHSNDSTQVFCTTIGSDCTIGSCCNLNDSAIFKGCRIEDKVKLTNSLVFENCCIKSGSICNGSTLLRGVTIGPNANIPPKCVVFLRDDPVAVHLLSPKSVTDIGCDFGAESNKLVAVRFADLPRPVTSALFWPGLLRKPNWSLPLLRSTKSLSSGLRVSERDSRTTSLSISKPVESGGFNNSPHGGNEPNQEFQSPESNMLNKEMDETIDKFLNEKVAFDKASLEISSLKCAYIVNVRELTTSLVRAILSAPLRRGLKDGYLKELWKGFSPSLCLLELMKRYVNSTESKHDCLKALCTPQLSSSPVILADVAGLLTQLYNLDLVDDDSVFSEWFESLPAEMTALRSAAKPFIEWLENSDDEE